MESKACTPDSLSTKKGNQMKTIIALVIGMALGFCYGKYGPHKMIETTSKGINASANAASKALDTANKKIK